MSNELAELRDIGWSIWDPIGLNTDTGPPEGAADEYDSYLLQARGMLHAGRSQGQVADFLMEIESEHMALGHGPDAHDRAMRTVQALQRVL
ncbi:hypothetical protein PMI07_004939 [Rhizobium sp. CF080]|uniref:hypothetical protein n=1 Tax=Rhizobium sp. (strain CF080) TaxID=1144310 RepID=UPI000271898C|nr:hypothetical protein [Rhizobium sp. CF080]EUB98658.1 hypothetical protein PMI07_004939 [Rhizobium sp. CF080]